MIRSTSSVSLFNRPNTLNTMTLDSSKLLKKLEPPVRAGGASGATLRPQRPFENQGFDELVLSARLGKISSGKSLNVDFKTDQPLTPNQLERLASAADDAQASGSRRALMLIDGRSFVMDIESRELTAELAPGAQSKVSGIDTAVYVNAGDRPAAIRTLKPPGNGLMPAKIAKQFDTQGVKDPVVYKPKRPKPQNPAPKADPKPAPKPSGTPSSPSTPAAPVTPSSQPTAPAPPAPEAPSAPIGSPAIPSTPPAPPADPAPPQSGSPQSPSVPVAPPAAPTPPDFDPSSYDLVPAPPGDSHIILNNQSDKLVQDISASNREYGVLVDNGQHSDNVIINGFTATNCERYGMYLGDVSNWTIANTTLHQMPDASEHGLRIAGGNHVTISNTMIDSSQAGKSSMWLIDVNDIQINDLHTKGGAIRIGARPEDNQGSPDATNITISDSVIEKTGGGDNEAFAIWPGSNHIHLANLDITLTTSANWIAIDSRNTANITWENIRVNGVLITGFEGVNLGGMSQAEAAARGIGPSA